MTSQSLAYVLEQDLHQYYGLTRWEANGLFQPDALQYWAEVLRTGLEDGQPSKVKTVNDVLQQTCGAPPVREGRVA